MSIQTRLRQQRYGTSQYQVPTRDEMKDFPITRKEKYALNRDNIYLKIYEIYSSPAKGRYREPYDKLLRDYCELYDSKSKSFRFIVHLMVRRLKYFIANKQYYNHSFIDYSVIWYVASLFQMRKAKMKRMAMAGEIPYQYNYNAPCTNGYYPLVKPMQVKHTVYRATLVYNLLYDYIVD